MKRMAVGITSGLGLVALAAFLFFQPSSQSSLGPTPVSNASAPAAEAQASPSDTDDIRAERLRLMAKKASIVKIGRAHV